MLQYIEKLAELFMLQRGEEFETQQNIFIVMRMIIIICFYAHSHYFRCAFMLEYIQQEI